jgi:histidinol-phosphate/aromatic aminotransferase/cobyric acid decarboxylase-like protein
MDAYGFDTFLRVNAGTDQENKTFIAELQQVMDLPEVRA